MTFSKGTPVKIKGTEDIGEISAVLNPKHYLVVMERAYSEEQLERLSTVEAMNRAALKEANRADVTKLGSLLVEWKNNRDPATLDRALKLGEQMGLIPSP